MCDISKYIENIEKFWNKAKELGIPKHLIRIPDLFLKPRQFWKEYELMSLKDKVIQFVVYSVLLAVALWIGSYSKLSSGDFVKIISLELAAVFVYVAILYIANSIVNKSWRGGWFFVVFCCYMKLFCIIPQIIVLRAYYDTETPLLMAIFSLLPLIAELLLLFYPAYVCQTCKRNVVMAILLSVVFLNLYDCIFIATGWPMPSNSNYDNMIAKERYELGKSIHNTYDIPYCVAMKSDGNVVWYLYSNPTDSIASVKFDDPNKYIEIVKEDLDSLKAIATRCHFKTNKVFFNEFYNVKRDVVYIHDTKMYKSSPILKETDIMFDSIIVDKLIYREFNRDLQERNTRLLEEDIKQAEQFINARSVNYVGALWHPCLYIYSLYSNNKEES